MFKKMSKILVACMVILSMVLSNLTLVHGVTPTLDDKWEFTAALSGDEAWNKDENKVFTTSQPSDKRTYLTASQSITGTYSSASLVMNNFQKDDYWELVFSTKGSTSVSFDAQVRASNTGPKDFEIYYLNTLDNTYKTTNFTYQTGTIKDDTKLKSITFTNKLTGAVSEEMKLPDDLQNKDQVTLRLVVASEQAVNGGAISQAGATNVNNIVLTNNGGSTTPLEKVASPSSDIASGSVVPSGSKVNFTTATPDAKIVYNFTSPGDTFTDMPPQGITINKDTTVYVKAIKAGMADSDVETFTYTVKDTEMTVMKISDARKEKEGTTVLIEGVVTYINGKNITIQEAQAGIVVRLLEPNSDIKIGNTIKVSGKIKNYYELLQVESPTLLENTEGGKLPIPRIVTISDLLNNPEKYESTRVKIVNATLGEVNPGGSTTLTQRGKSIDIRYMPEGSYPTDKNVDVTAVISSYFNSLPQLGVGDVKDVVENTTGDAVIKAENLFISEYVEGSSYNKALELYNGTGANIDLAKYTLKMYKDGKTEIGASLTLNGTIKDGGTYVIYNQTTSATDAFKQAIDTIPDADKIGNTPMTSFNGNDTIVLEHDGEIIDIIGKIGENPYYDDGGFGLKCWATADGKKKTMNQTLIRNPLMTSISSVFSFDEWDGYDIDTFKNLGRHLMTDGTITEKAAAPTSSLKDNQAVIGDKLVLSTKTAGGEIYYRIGDGSEKVYTTPIPIITLPVKVTAYTKAPGYFDSDEVIFPITQAKVSTVKASPNGGAVKPGTKLRLSTKTKGAEILYTLGDNENWMTYNGDDSIVLDTLPIIVKTKAVLKEYLDSEISTLQFTERENDSYQQYFGQLHAHTNFSDGAGSCEDAYEYASTKAENIDFLAITDHSNSFDNADQASITDGSMSTEWKTGHELAKKYTTKDFVGLYGYEMTWSNGLGHLNTFNTEGFQSRTQPEFSTYSTALQNYYAALKKSTGSISQFNHPGTTFGDFSDFGNYDPEIDSLINLVEVGNGEGTLGSSGYFPSYEYYTRALDKGWHVAPSNNQDNHKGKWGDANTARTVILADSLTQENIYGAMRDRRVYATEDQDLNISYTLNDEVMGTILDSNPDKAMIQVDLSDPSDQTIGKVEVIVNGGIVAASKEAPSNKETITFDLDADYAYYYIKVTQGDGDIAVTAPVWTGDVDKAGVSKLDTSSSLTIKGAAHDVNLSLFNNEDSDLEVKSINFHVDGKVVHEIDLAQADLSSVAPLSTKSYTFDYTHGGLGKSTIVAEVKAVINGVERVYKENLYLTYVDSSMVTKIVVDGTHFNDYVSGYYGDNMGNFKKIAADENALLNIVTDKITDETLKDASLLIVSAPAKKDGTANAGEYKKSTFDDEFIQTVKNYTDLGGMLIVSGLADYQDSADVQSSTEINKLLKAIGATNRLNSDELMDDANNGGQAYRLYLNRFNTDSAYMKNFQEGQTYSSYSGASVLVGDKGSWLVKGHDTTYSIDSQQFDNNYTEIQKGEAVALAAETLDSGAQVFTSGTVFMSNFEVKAEVDNIWDVPYANKTIMENVLDEVKVELDKTSIQDIRKGTLGEIYSAEGYVTAGTESGNAFFDSIYIQDETTGINIFPINDGTYNLGDKVRIVGQLDTYLGDLQLRLITVEKLNEPAKIIEPSTVSTKDAMNYDLNGGRLVKVQGEVMSIEMSNSLIETIMVKDSSGKAARVFIDGYITYADTTQRALETNLRIGDEVSAVGLVSFDPLNERIRVRNRGEVVRLDSQAVPPPTENPGEPADPNKPGGQSTVGAPSSTAVNTGDSTSITLLFILLSAASILCIGILYRRKKYNK